jgi:type IV pilus assembly protein PilV
MKRILNNHSGFTLIEGMIASVVLATGLLALAGMQHISLSRNVSANEYTRVANLAADIIERIQYNRRNVLDYDGITVTSTQACAVAITKVMANGDCTQWRTLLLNSGLASVTGAITAKLMDPAPSVNPVTMNRTTVTITISWTYKQHGEANGQNNSVTFQTRVSPE